MTEVRSAVNTDASPERVWRVLTDWKTFPSWNPFIRSAEGRLRRDSRIRVRLQLGRRLVNLRPRLTVVDPPRELRWLNTLIVRGIFDVERRFHIDAVPSGARLIQSETATGLLAPLLMRLLRKDILAGYRAMEVALVARAEHRKPASPTQRPTLERTAMSPNRRSRAMTGPRAWRKRINSHETFTHDSIDSLGYDWERIADPTIAPRFPRKIYLPRTTEDIVAAVRECAALGERPTIRSKGHSSNDLVLTDGGTLLLTEKLNRILDVDEDAMTVTVQAGAVSAEVDDELATRGLGLPVIGDHNHITVGGFASVGGISPASHRFGLFVDTVNRLQYVTWDGELVTCSRDENPADFHRVLTGLGRHGVIATLSLQMIRVDKYGTVLRNRQRHYYDFDEFVAGSAESIRNPGGALMERGVWVDIPVAGRTVALGQFSAYHPTQQTRYARVRDSVSYDLLHGLGYVGGRLPAGLDRVLKYIGMAGVMFSPMYATMKNVEFFTDKILDSTVSDPTRMFIVLAPLHEYESLFRESYELMRKFRADHDCFTFISVYVKSITSTYLAQGSGNDRFCELMFYCGMNAGGMSADILEDLVTRLDDICISHSGFRYMHSRTSKDPERREKIDPNMYYIRQSTPLSAAAPQ